MQKRRKMIRCYKKEDIKSIEALASLLHVNYKFYLDEFSNCLVYEYNNEIIAFITYSIIYERAEIIDIIVKEDYRNNKIGMKLLNAVINICKDQNCENITLEVKVDNKIAINFYKKFNFRVVSTRKDYYENSNAFLMEKDLR